MRLQYLLQIGSKATYLTKLPSDSVFFYFSSIKAMLLELISAFKWAGGRGGGGTEPFGETHPAGLYADKLRILCDTCAHTR